MTMDEKRRGLPFGKRIYVGNFYFLKATRSLSKKQLAALRDEAHITVDMRKGLSRAGVPYIIVSTVSETWQVRYGVGCEVFSFIDHEYDLFREGGEEALRSLATMLYMDTAVLGDGQYLEDKGKALLSFMERQKAPDISKEADDEILESERVEHEARANIVDMAAQVIKEADDGGDGQAD